MFVVEANFELGLQIFSDIRDLKQRNAAAGGRAFPQRGSALIEIEASSTGNLSVPRPVKCRYNNYLEDSRSSFCL